MIVEPDSVPEMVLFKLAIKKKGNIHQSLLDYLGLSAGCIYKKTEKKEKPEEIYLFLKENNVQSNKSEFKEFLNTVSYLCQLHQSSKEISNKINLLLNVLKEDIKNIFSEKEIPSVFLIYKNRSINQILIDNNILLEKDRPRNTIEYAFMLGKKRMDEKKDIRQKIEDASIIIEMIKEDNIEEFISFVEHYPIDLNKKVIKEEQIYNLISKQFTPIEYSIIFGAIATFKYLYIKGVNINVYPGNCDNDIIEYAILGRNYEIIHLLEERNEIINAMNNQDKQKKYIELCIRMHYNEIFEYFITNYSIQLNKEIIKLFIDYRNYQLFDQLIERNQIEFIDKKTIFNLFLWFCQSGNEEIVKILINYPSLNINKTNKIFHHCFEMIIIQKKMRKGSRLYLLLLIQMELSKNKIF